MAASLAAVVGAVVIALRMPSEIRIERSREVGLRLGEIRSKMGEPDPHGSLSWKYEEVGPAVTRVILGIRKTMTFGDRLEWALFDKKTEVEWWLDARLREIGPPGNATGSR